MTLKDLPIGKTATIRSVGGEGALRQHFLDMGLIPHGDVTMVNCASTATSSRCAWRTQKRSRSKTSATRFR